LRIFLNDPTPFDIFVILSPFEEDLALYLNKVEFSSPKDNLHKLLSLNEFGLLVLEKIKKVSVFLLFLLSSPLGEGQSPSFEQT
jgi:hypothetical protein